MQVVLLGSLFAMMMQVHAWTQQEIADFRATKQRKLDSQPVCLQAMAQYLDNAKTAVGQAYWGETLHGINDATIMQKEACNSLPISNLTMHEELNSERFLHGAEYSSVGLNLSTIPVIIRGSACLPAVCSEADLIDFGMNVSIGLSTAI